MKIETTVDIYYDTEEDLARGECELVTRTQKNPYGTWKKCVVGTLIVETEEES